MDVVWSFCPRSEACRWLYLWDCHVYSAVLYLCLHPSYRHHPTLTIAKLYCLLTKAEGCE